MSPMFTSGDYKLDYSVGTKSYVNRSTPTNESIVIHWHRTAHVATTTAPSNTSTGYSHELTTWQYSL